MTDEAVTYQPLDGSAKVLSNCSICGINPATLRFAGARDGNCCLPCACVRLATLAQKAVDSFTRETGTM